MRTKVTLVLLLLNVVLFYYVFYVELPAQAERRTLEARRRVLGPEAAAIDSFTRVSKNSPTARVEKHGDTWWLAQPYEWPANFNAVSRILNELQLLEHETSFPVADLARTGQSLADYGLADPALTFSFTSAGKAYELKIGDDTRIGNRLYLLSPDGKRIHVVGRSLADSLGLSLDELRSPTIFTVPVFEVRSLSLQTAAPANLKIRLRREGDRWMFETPILARANKNAVEIAINALNALQTDKFIETSAADLDRTGLASPTLRVTLEGNARRETLLLGNAVSGTPPAAKGEKAPDTEYFARIEDKPAVFTTAVPADVLADLRAAQEKLRDPHILDFEPATVTAFTLATPGQSELSLQRLEPGANPDPTAAGPAAPGAASSPAPVSSGTSWQLVVRGAAGQPPQTIPADTARVQDLLQKLQLLSAVKFLSDAPSAADLENFGFNRPEREIALSLSTGGGPRGTDPSTLTLQIGQKPDERGVAYARVTNAPFVYQVDPEVLELTPPLARHFRQRLLRELPEGARITALKLTDLTTNTVVFDLTNAAALTPETLPATNVAESARAALLRLLAQVRSLHAQRFTADTFNPDYAESEDGHHPWKYRLDVTLALSGGTNAAQTPVSALYLTDRLGGGTQIAGTNEFGGVNFALTQPFIDALFALTYAPKNDPGPPAPAKPAQPAETPGPQPPADKPEASNG
jgi:hypothetical protein